MYRVIRDVGDLNQLRDGVSILSRVLDDEKIYSRVSKDVECLNVAYGKNRDLIADLGGYVIVLWGNVKETEETYGEILQYHNLNDNEAEYVDEIRMPERDITVTFRLFLCSSDYAVEVIHIQEI